MVPNSFTPIAKKKVMMQLDQGYEMTESSEFGVVLKRTDPMYGHGRDAYQRVDEWGRFTNCYQSDDLVKNIEDSRAGYEERLKHVYYPENAHAALQLHLKEVYKLTAEFRKAVIDE